jgi:3-hydroxyacyl-[acyl-carrier-protein] dehydratase
MPAAPLLDLSTIPLDKLVITREEIYRRLPHRFEFMQLDGIVHIDYEARLAVGLREVREDEFWVRGHIPGRPLLPGVLMVETAAQMASYLTHLVLKQDKFYGFGGIDAVKFRAPVSPPARMYFIVKAIDMRPRRTICDTQGILDGQLAFEGRITGMPV